MAGTSAFKLIIMIILLVENITPVLLNFMHEITNLVARVYIKNSRNQASRTH